MREYSTPVVVDIPRRARLTDTVFDRADTDPSRVVLRRRAGRERPAASEAAAAREAASGEAASGPVAPGPAAPWRDVTAGEFAGEVLALAKGLIAAGIQAGDRVGLLSRTRYEWTVADYGIWAAGAVTVPIYETSSAEQVEWVLSDSGARALIVETPHHLAAIADVVAVLPAVSRVWLIDPAGTAPDGGGAVGAARPLAELAAAGAVVSDDAVERRRQDASAEDIASIIYTSGTTGRPKGCVITHANLLSDVRNAVYGPLSPVFDVADASTLLFLPLAHSFARIIQVGCLEAGITLGHTPDVKDLLGDLASFRPTFLLAVPRVFEKVYNGAEQQAAASPVRERIFRAAANTAIAWSQASVNGAAAAGGPGGGLRARHAVFDRLVYSKLRVAMGGRVAHAVSGGAPLGERLCHFFRGAGVTILEGYGLTETSAAATVNPADQPRIGSVGRPLPGVSARIDDDGEILLRGRNVFQGYWRNEQATAEVLDGGWLRTGDLGEIDADGYLRVTGRKKELIVTAGGKNVAPAVLEDRLRAHPLVSQCVVVGDGRPYIGCLLTLDEEALPAWLARHLGGGQPPAAGPSGPDPAAGLVAGVKDNPRLLAELQAAVNDANKAVSRAEAIRRFRVLDDDFTEQNGHLTPSLKVRRAAVVKDFAADIDALYA